MSISSDRVAIVIVTFNRPDYLRGLLNSICSLTVKPNTVIVVDNNSNIDTKKVLDEFKSKSSGFHLLTKRLNNNLGGAGGFSIGVEIALSTSVEWMWLMDDDVIVLPDGLEKMMRWKDRFRCFHSGRLDSNGQHFFCEQWIHNGLAVQIPFFKHPYHGKGYFLTNYGCFEGMMIHREVVEKIGLPDPRFFIVWDDAIYGWLASKKTEVAFIQEECLQKVRKQKQIGLGVRHLNDSSDLSRYHALRNREIIKEYFRDQNEYIPIVFEIGTFLVLLKEIFRMLLVERRISGFSSLMRGILKMKYKK